MSHKREPMLSDNEVRRMVDKWIAMDRPEPYPSLMVRGAYEDLIDKGVLMAVKEAELHHPTVPEEVWRQWLTGSEAEFSMLVTKCCSRNPWCPPWGLGKGEWDTETLSVIYPRKSYVCPGCGAKIKQPQSP